jgi:hypothetical protein
MPNTVSSGVAAWESGKGIGQGIEQRESRLQPNRKSHKTNNLQLTTYKPNVVLGVNNLLNNQMNSWLEQPT